LEMENVIKQNKVIVMDVTRDIHHTRAHK